MGLKAVSNIPLGVGGNSYSQIARKIALSLPSQLTVIPAGDSITAGSNTANSGIPQYNFATDYAEGAIFSAGRYTIIRNAGIAGNTSAQLLARLQTDVIAFSPNVCMVMIGTNDYVASPTNANYANLMNNVEQIIIKLLDASILPVLVTPPPSNTNTVMAKRVQWYYYALAAFYGIPLFDLYKIWTDPKTGQYLSGFSSDGTHPLPAAMAVSNPLLASVLANINNPTQYFYTGVVSETSGGEFSNMIRNGSFAQITTPPNPDSWVINTTNATFTTPTATYPYTGNDFNYVKTVSGAAFALSGSGIAIGANYVAGDTLYIAIRVNVAGLTPATAIGYNIQLQGATIASVNFKGVYNGNFTFATTWVVPVGETSYTPEVFVQDVGTYIVDNYTVLNVTQHNAIWQPGIQGIQ